MTDIIEVEIPTDQIYVSPDDFTCNPSYDSCNRTSDNPTCCKCAGHVQEKEKGKSAIKHSSPTIWLSGLAVVLAVGALAVSLVTGFVLKPESRSRQTELETTDCCSRKTNTSQV
jgi:hypothetical protein